MIQDGREFVVPSVTKILGVISKGDALVQWAANQVVSCVKEKVSLDEVYSGELIHEIAENCKFAFRSKKDLAADIGTEAHSYIEGILHTAILEPESRFSCNVLIDTPEVLSCVHAACDWLTESGILPLYVERKIYSKFHEYSGTSDLIARDKEGRLVLVDWKSSKKLYPEYFLQTAAYSKAFEEETGEKIQGRILVRLGKEDGAFEVQANYSRGDLAEDYSVFLAAKRLYDWQRSLTKKDCTRCKRRDLPLDYFHVSGGPWCKECRSKYCKSWNKENKVKASIHNRKRNYGISNEEFETLLVQQLSKCGICKVELTQPHVDHDHETGKIRGLLCRRCNLALGHLNDSISNLENSIAYLMKSK